MQVLVGAVLLASGVQWGTASHGSNTTVLADLPRELQQETELTRLNNFLSGLDFGANPGPCPNKAGRCSTDVTKMPRYVARVEVPLTIAGFTATNNIGNFKNGDGSTNVGWAAGGDVDLWRSEFSNLRVGQLKVTKGGATTTRLPFEVDVSGVSLGLDTDYSVRGLFIGIDFLPSWIRDDRSWSCPWCWGLGDTLEAGNTAGDHTLQLIQSELNRLGGMDLKLKFQLLPAPGQSLETDLPRRIEYQPENTEPCFFDGSLNTRAVRFPRGLGYDIFGIDLGTLTGFIIGLLRGTISTAVCAAALQATYLDKEGNDPEQWDKGGLNIFISSVYDRVYQYVTPGTRDEDDVRATQDEVRASATSSEREKAMNFLTNKVFGYISTGINGVLGDYAVGDGYDGRNILVINQLVDLVLERRDGKVVGNPPWKPLKYIELDPDLFKTTVVLSPVELDFEVLEYTIEGLNSFTDDFRAVETTLDLENTLRNTATLERMSLSTTIRMDMRPGKWVTNQADYPGRKESFTFKIDIAARDIFLDAYVSTLVDYTKLEGNTLGQFLGVPKGKRSSAALCLLRSVDAAQLGSMQLSASVQDPVFENLTPGLAETLEALTGLVTGSIAGLLRTKLPAISENLLRVEVNKLLVKYLDEGLQCPDYMPPDKIEYIRFDDNLAVELVNDALNQVVGGDPIVTSSLDINSLIDFYARTYIEDINSVLPSVIKLGRVDRGTWTVGGPRVLELRSFDGASWVALDAIKFSNLDSIYRLEFDAAGARENSINASIGKGTYLNEDGTVRPSEYVTLEFEVRGNVCRDGQCDKEVLVGNEDAVHIEFSFDFDFLAMLYAEINNNELMVLTLAELPTLCSLVPVEAFNFPKFDLDTTLFYTTIRPANGGSFSRSRVGTALTRLQAVLAETGKDDGGHVITTNQARYLLRRAGLGISTLIETMYSLNRVTPGNCGTAEIKFPETYGWEGLLNLPVPNTTWVDDQPIIKYWPRSSAEDDSAVVAPSSQWESKINTTATRPFDIRDNTLVERIRNFVRSDGLDDALPVLANSSFFSQYLTLQEDGTIDLDLDLGLFLESYANSDIIEDLRIIPGKLKMNNIGGAKFAFLKEYDPDARFTTAHTVSFDYDLNASVSFAIETNGAFVGDAPDTVAREEIRVDFQVDGLALDMVTYLAADLQALQELTISTFVQVDENQVFSLRPDVRQCMLKAVMDDGIGIPGFQATYTQIKGVNVVPINGDDEASKLFTDAGAEAAGAALDALVETVKSEFADITQGPVREYLHGYLQELLATSRSDILCPLAKPPPLEEDNRFFNFETSSQIDTFYKFVEDELLDPASAFNVNVFITAFVSQWLQGFSYEIKNFPLSYNQESFGDFTVAVKRVSFENLDTVDRVMLFDHRPVQGQYPGPFQPYTTRTWFGVGGGPDNIRVEIDILLQVDELFEDRENMIESDLGTPTRVQNDLRVIVDFSYVELRSDLVTKLDIPTFLQIRPESFLDLVQYPCLLEAFPDNGLQVKDFLLGLGDVSATLECIGVCNSPDLEFLEGSTAKENEAFNTAVTDAINTTVTLLNAYIKSDEFEDALSEEIDLSTTNCIKLGEPLDSVEVEESEVARYMGVVGLSGLFATLVVFAFLVPLHMRRRDMIMKSSLLKHAAKERDMASAELVLQEQRLLSAFQHPAIPLAHKLVVPLVICANVVFFATANFMALGASVQLKLSVFGDTTKPLDLLDFTLESSINDMWSAGTYALSILIAVFSGGWPYLKNLLMLFCWFAPATVMSGARRGTMLEILDTLGKWSIIDVYVLIMLTVGFRFYISSSYIGGIEKYVTKDAVIVDVVVTPGWGIYGFVIGAIGSLLVNHFMIHLHRRALAADEKLADKIAGVYVAETPTQRVAAFRHRFNAADASGRIYGFGPGTKLVVGALLALSFILIVAGAFVDLMTFEFLGLAGIAINLIEPELTTVTYSLASIAVAIVDGSSPDTITRAGILFLQIVYLLFAFIMPVLLVLLLGAIWFVPMRMQEQRKFLFVAEIFAAWEALLVFLVSVVAAILQISELAQFIVRNSTGTICANLELFLRERSFSETDAKCFDVNASLESTGFLLIAGAVLLLVLVSMLFRLLNGVVDDRERANRRRECSNPRFPVEDGHKLRRKLLRLCTVPVARIRPGDMPAEGAGTLSAAPGSAPGFGPFQSGVFEFEEDEHEKDRTRSVSNPLFIFGRSRRAAPPPPPGAMSRISEVDVDV